MSRVPENSDCTAHQQSVSNGSHSVTSVPPLSHPTLLRSIGKCFPNAAPCLLQRTPKVKKRVQMPRQSQTRYPPPTPPPHLPQLLCAGKAPLILLERVLPITNRRTSSRTARRIAFANLPPNRPVAPPIATFGENENVGGNRL